MLGAKGKPRASSTPKAGLPGEDVIVSNLLQYVGELSGRVRE